MISVGVSRGRAAVEAIFHEWEVLVGDSFSKIFSQPAWYLAWIDAFEPSRIVIVTARSDNRLVGVLPLARERTDSRGMFFRQIAPIARGDYQPPVVSPELAAEVLPLMLDEAFRHFGKRGAFWWPNIPRLDPSFELLRTYLASRSMHWVETSEMAPRLTLDNNADFAAVEKKWSSSHRIDVRRQRKRLAEKGAVSLWKPASLDEADAALTEFFRVHDEKWLAEGFPGMFQTAGQQKHFRAILHRLWGRGMHFSTVRCGDANVSYGFAFVAGGFIQWFRPTYRREFYEFSPGKIHIALLVEEACALRMNGIDFLLGEESYKKMWGKDLTEVVSIYAGFHSWSPAYLWFSRGKPWVKQRLARTYVNLKVRLQKFRKS